MYFLKVFVVTVFYDRNNKHLPIGDDFYFTTLENAVKGLNILLKKDYIETAFLDSEPEYYTPDPTEPFEFYDLEHSELFLA